MDRRSSNWRIAALCQCDCESVTGAFVNPSPQESRATSTLVASQTLRNMAEDIDVASHYGIQTAFPETWPAELDESDESESEQYAAGANTKRRSTRYSALGRGSGLLGGSHRTGDNVAKKDESDPLGSSDSVMYILKKRGVPIDDDMRLRNRFLLSSTSFSPALFLSQAHQNASAEELIEGLQFLSRSIDQKSASLKELVEANFERFVRAKATIDSVYTEMRYHGAAKSRPPSHRASGQYRYSLVGNAPPAQASQSANKTALVKESEYGVKGIRAPLVEASVKAEELWGPALSGREREQDLYAVVTNVERNRSVFEIGGNISKAIKQQDFDRVFEEYRRAKTLTNEARSITDRAATEKRELTDAESHTMIGTGRMWTDVEQQVDAFKRDLWRRLSNVHTPSSSHLTAAGPVEEHMELIGALLELGVEDNPVWVWLISSYELLKTKLTAFCERSIVEIEVLRRRLAANEKPSPRVMTALFRASLREGADPKDKIDTDQTIEMWECIQAFLTKLLSVQTGLLGEVIEFWETAQSFINGSKQKMLPTGFEGESRKHHRLPSDGVRELQEGIVELVDLIRQNVLTLFTEPPIEDISLLFSPVPPTPGTPLSHLTPTESRFKLDPKNAPPPSPIRGEVGEEYAFWPPYSNSLSGVHYLSKFLVLIGTAASEMAALSPITAGSKSYDHLKSLVSVTRERSVRVACATWNRDAENCKMLEDWTRDPERRELTTMPGLFVAFESTVMAGMQKILYISEAMSKAGSVDVVTPPPAKILQMVRTQFVTSVYKALSGLVENAERPVMSNDEDLWILAEPSRPAKSMDSAPVMATSESIDAKNRVSFVGSRLLLV